MDTMNMMSLPSLLFVSDLEWRERAECRTMPKTPFYDYSAIGISRATQREYKKIAMEACGRCAVRQECLEFAVRNNDRHGIWAGTLPEERKNLYATFKATGIVETPTGW